MKNILIVFAALSLATSSAFAQTKPLTSSASFQSKADKTNPTFSGRVSIGGNSNYYLDIGSGPYINFAPNTLFQYNAQSGNFELYLRDLSNPKWYVTSSNFTSNIPFYAQGSVNVKGTATDGFYMGVNAGSGNRPYVAFDGFNSRIEFTGGGAYAFYVGGNQVAKLDGNGNLFLRGQTYPGIGGNCC